jgi:Fe-S cluster assembly iron-binding protein IscA
MLTLTDNASTAVRDLSTRALGTDTGGLRISSPDDGSTNLSVSVAPEPAPADEIVENAGARVFLDAQAAAVVGDKILDAQLDDAGAVRFALAAQ